MLVVQTYTTESKVSFMCFVTALYWTKDIFPFFKLTAVQILEAHRQKVDCS